MRTLLITNNQKTVVAEVYTDALTNSQENVTIYDIKMIKGSLQDLIESGFDVNIPNSISFVEFKTVIDDMGLNLGVIDPNSLTTVSVVDNSTLTFDFDGGREGVMQAGEVGKTYSELFTAENYVGRVVYTVVDGALPEGLSLHPIGDLSGIPTESGEEFEFTVRATDSTGQYVEHTFTIEVTAAPSTEAKILTYSIPTGSEAVIDDEASTISIEMPYGTSLAALTPTFTLSAGATASPASGVEDDFTNPVTVTITAEDGVTTQAWTVTVEIAAE